MALAKERIGIVGNINLKLTIAALLTVTATSLIALFVFLPQFREELKFAAAVIGGFSGVYSAYYIAIGLKTNIERDSIYRAIELVKGIDKVDMISIRSFVEEHFNKTTPEEFDSKIRENPDLFKNLCLLLATLEDISVAIQRGLADEKAAKDALATLVDVAYSKFGHFISAERGNYSDNRIYKELELMASKWKQNQSLYSGS